MSLKLGELLISEGLITQEKLDEALKCHIIFGIKLGSSLIELGFVDEDVLVNLLSRKLGVPAVSNIELMDVPAAVIDRMSASVAEKFRVVPVRYENKCLHVAMSDPTDLKALEELSFITGGRVVPMIAPEVHVLHALEKYYKLPRDHRYVWANSNLQIKRDRSRGQGGEGGKTGGAIKTEPHNDSPFKDLLHVPIPAELHTSSPFDQPVEKPSSPKPGKDIYTIDRLSIDFSKARNRDDIANIFIKYLGQRFLKGALLTIRGHSAVGWRAVNNERQIKNFESQIFELSKSSELSEILIGKHYFFGPLSDSHANQPFIAALGLSASDTVLSFPVIMNTRIVAMILVSSDVIHLQQRLSELQKLVYKASLAFQILVLKNKLLQT